MEIKEKIIDEEIVGKYFKQNCGDTLLVLNEYIVAKNREKKFKCQFQNHPCEVFASKYNILKGKVLNPQIEVDEFINKEWPQKCGDILKILRKTEEREIKNIKTGELGAILFECEFIKYPYKIKATKTHIKSGDVLNPQIEIDEFINKKWLQNCGDILRIIRKTEERLVYSNGRVGNILFECEFEKYPYKIKAIKGNIIKGQVFNPRIEEEFLKKEWPQTGGEIIKVLEKTNKKRGSQYLYKIEFQKYKYIDYRTKSDIIIGNCLNPLIDRYEFIGHEFPQKCGDILIVLEKTNKRNRNNTILYKIQFKKYLYIDYKTKAEIKAGICLNPKLPYFCNLEENTLREYIKSIYSGEVIKSFGNTKEYNYYEADIYLPEKRIIIEYNGSIWHEEGNPKNPFSKPIGYHEQKRKFFAEKGIDLYYIWDYEWFEDRRHTIISESCKEKVKNIIENKII